MKMSDREDENHRDSPVGSMSEESDVDRKMVTYRSRSKGTQSRSPSVHKPKRKYSRSRSRSRSHHKARRSSKYRSRSRSPRRSYQRYSRSGSHSDTYSPPPNYRRGRGRSHSRSPTANRRRHNGNKTMKRSFGGAQENPEPNRCLGVFGLSIYTTESQINSIFCKYGPVESVQVVIDAKTGHSRGFCFVYFKSCDDARHAKEECTGMDIDGRKIRVDFSVTNRAHTPTPGIYMGKPTYSDNRYRRDREYGEYYGGGGCGSSSGGYRGGRYRSPSPYYRPSRRRERSRSRSYSPRGRY